MTIFMFCCATVLDGTPAEEVSAVCRRFGGKFLFFKLDEPLAVAGPHNVINPEFAAALWNAVSKKTGFLADELVVDLKVVGMLDFPAGDLVVL